MILSSKIQLSVLQVIPIIDLQAGSSEKGESNLTVACKEMEPVDGGFYISAVGGGGRDNQFSGLPSQCWCFGANFLTLYTSLGDLEKLGHNIDQ